MLDFSHVASNPNVDIQIFQGNSSVTQLQWQTWVKPRGVKMVYMIGVGGGSSGGCGIASGTTSGGGAGGASGAQTSLMIPAMFVPDRLYIQAGQGGKQPATLVSAAVGVVGLPTYVAIEPTTALSVPTMLLLANPGAVTGTAATITAGGLAGTAAAVTTIAAMPLAGKGQYTFFAGAVGGVGGASTAAGIALLPPTTGLMVSGGTGGGGCNATVGFAGGAFTIGANTLGTYFPPIPGGNPAVTSVPAFDGSGGIVIPNYIMNYGGCGGGGSTTTAGGFAGNGGHGAPGCGGGGGGGTNTTALLVTGGRPGNGGDGFVIIYSW